MHWLSLVLSSTLTLALSSEFYLCWLIQFPRSASGFNLQLTLQPQPHISAEDRKANAGSMESIHILGLGNMGKYLAYGLMRRYQQQALTGSRPFPPPTLLFHRRGLLDDWERANRSIRYTDKTRPGSSEAEGPRAEGFRVELVDPLATQGLRIENHPEVVVGNKTPIKYLIVATKAYAVAAALSPLKHRLDRNSHILLLHNGMGKSVSSVWCTTAPV